MTFHVLFALVAVAFRSVGAAVQDLHLLLDALHAFDRFDDLDPREFDEGEYGPSTERVVRAVLEAIGQSPGEPNTLDAAAAEAINAFAFDKELFDAVHGRMSFADGSPAAGVKVQIFDVDNLTGLACGVTSTNEDGHYRAYYFPAFYAIEREGVSVTKDRVEIVVRVLSASGAESFRSETHSDPGHELRVDGTLHEAAAVRRRVRGTVTDPRGKPLAGVRVTVGDRDIGTDADVLGDQRTGEDGAFSIAYWPEKFSRGDAALRGKKTADVVFTLKAEERLPERFTIERLPVAGDPSITSRLPVSPEELLLGIVARDDELVRIVAFDLPAHRGPSEFERLIAALAPLTERRPLVDFDEAATRDVSFASREIGEPVERVADLVAAHRLASRPFEGTPPAALYGLARLLGARDPRLIALRRVDELVTGLHRAVEDGVIPELDDPDQLAHDVHAIAARAALGAPLPGMAGSMGSVLEGLADEETQAMLLNAAGEHPGSTEQFWQTVAPNLVGEDTRPIQYALQLGMLTRNNGTLAKALRDAVPQAGSLRQLAFGLDRARLETIVRDSGALPEEPIANEPPAAARARLVGEIGGLLEAACPTSVVARTVRTLQHNNQGAIDAPTAQFLERVALDTEFDLAKDSIDTLVAELGGTLFDGVPDPADRTAAVGGTKRIQRLFKVSTNPEALGEALARPTRTLQGAMDIARLGKAAFLSEFTTASEETRQSLALMHDRARTFAEGVAGLIVAQHQDLRDILPAAAADAPASIEAGDPPAEAEAEAEVESIPTWSDFFGSTATCDCDDCRSVVGPAAYLVDLFEFLDKRCSTNMDGATPLDILIGNEAKGISGRRPDLAHIKLSCDNTNTTIPTIDLINEILESVVAFHQTTPLAAGPDGEALEPEQLDPNEPSPGVSGAELSAAPEHVIEKAYAAVSGAIFPISLPYDRLLATGRAHMVQAGLSRADLIELFAKDRSYARAAEILGLLARDVEIITGSTVTGAPLETPIPNAAMFDEPEGSDWPGKLKRSEALMAALEISFNDLMELLRTRFVGGKVPRANDETDIASRLFLTVAELAELREANYEVQPGSHIAEGLARGGLSSEEVKAYIEAFGNRLSTTIVLDPPIGCNPGAIHLVHLDGSAVEATDLVAMHRFVRLAKRMGIGFAELDEALFASAGAQPPVLDVAMLERLADFRSLKVELALDWQHTAALAAEIGTHGKDCLYDQLFPPNGLARAYPLFRRASDGSVLSAGAPIADGIPGIAAALFVPRKQLAAAAATLEFTTLSLAATSALYRTVMLARSLGIEPEGLLSLHRAMGGPALNVACPPADLLAFVRRARAVLAGGLSAARFPYIVGTGPASEGAAADLAKQIGALETALEPIAKQEERERAEEDQQAALLPPQPMADDAIAARKAFTANQRRQAAFALLVSASGLEPAILTLLVEDEKEGDTVIRALFRVGEGGALPAIEHFANLTAAGRPEAIRLLAGIGRLAQLVLGVGLDAAAVRMAAHDAKILTEAFATALLDPANDTKSKCETVEALARFAALSKEISRPDALATALRALVAGDWTDQAFAAASALLDRKTESVKAVPRDGVAALTAAEARRRPLDALLALRVRLNAGRRLGLEADAVLPLLAEPLGAKDLERLVAGVTSNYDATSWLGVSRQLSDPIREASRSALVAFLMRRDGVKDPDQLFARYFIDVQTNAFVLTSRIRQAIFAVQIFVQRCLMGLETPLGVSADQIDRTEWRVINRFQVWAARQRTLLYPEDLLDPAWRDNKTKLFRDFESAVQQADVTPANAARAYGTYLDDLRLVASLEVCGTFLQTVFEGREQGLFDSVLHVVGRSRGGVPRRYFYRRLNRYVNFEEWTDWLPIEADIQGVEQDRLAARREGEATPLTEAGVHVLPVVWHGQLHLFWPNLVRKTDEPTEPDVIDSQNPKIRPRYSRPYWEVKLSWVRRDGETWTSKTQSAALIETWWPDTSPSFPDPSNLVLKANADPSRLEIFLCQRDGTYVGAHNAFVATRVVEDMIATSADATMTGDHPDFSAYEGLSPSYMGFRTGGELKIVASPKKAEGDRVFSTPSGSHLATLNQSYAAPREAPFFVAINGHSYFAQASLGTTTARERIEAPLPVPEAFRPIDEVIYHPDLIVAAVPKKEKKAFNPWVAVASQQLSIASAAAIQSKPPIFLIPSLVVEPPPQPQPMMILPYWFGPAAASYRTIEVDAVNLTITPFHHPFADLFARTLRRDGLDALLTPETQRQTVSAARTFAGICAPDPARVTAPLSEGVEFGASSAYGTYNWELFFHAPMLMVQRLWDNGQLEAAVDVFHKVFDPLSATKLEDAWRFEELRKAKAIRLEDMLAKLSRPESDPERREVEAQIEAMRLYPFQAHRIARLRPLAYKKWAVAQYAKLRVAIGDSYLRRFTPEDVNQSIQHYIIAYTVMGPIGEIMSPRTAMPARTYAELRPDLDGMGNVMFAAEEKLGNSVSGAGGSAVGDAAAAGLLQRGAIGYFGIPRNDKLRAVQELVADRLNKVRNGRNIDGVQIQLPLFPPPIDPALLAQAAALGLSLETVLEELSAPRPPFRYQAMYRHAVEQAQALLELGEALLSVREKRDTEELAHRRATFETDMAKLILQTREQQVLEAEANRTTLAAEREVALTRWNHFRELLGADKLLPPGRDPQDKTRINNGRATAQRRYFLEPADSVSFERLQVIPDLMKGVALLGGGVGAGAIMAILDESAGGVSLAGGKILVEEKQELQASFEAVRSVFDAALVDMLANMLNLIPNFEAAVKPLGAGAAVHFGGQALAAAASAKARNMQAASAMHNFVASIYGRQASLVLRERDWVLQLNQAAADVLAIDAKIALADIQIDIAKRQRDTQIKDHEHAEQVQVYLSGKFSRTELYQWMDTRLVQLFRTCFDLAMEAARAAEACYRDERDPPLGTRFIQLAKPQAMREELMVGRELLTQLRKMDRSWIANATRGPELTRHISLKQINARALYNLRETGSAQFSIPEALFDIDHPGHYDRRIRSVQLSIPCIPGAYAPVTGTLTLVSSWRRKSPTLEVGPAGDMGAGQPSIAISSGRDDAGVFDLSLQDERYLPFEGRGVISEWKLDLPTRIRHFNYRTISDVVLTIRYTAKSAGEPFASDATDEVANALGGGEGEDDGYHQMVSVRHDLPDAWYSFQAGQGLGISLTNAVLPYVVRQHLKPTLKKVLAYKLPTGAAAAELPAIEPVATPQGWSFAIEGVNGPDEVDDIVLVTAFKLAS